MQRHSKLNRPNPDRLPLLSPPPSNRLLRYTHIRWSTIVPMSFSASVALWFKGAGSGAAPVFLLNELRSCLSGRRLATPSIRVFSACSTTSRARSMPSVLHAVPGLYAWQFYGGLNDISAAICAVPWQHPDSDNCSRYFVLCFSPTSSICATSQLTAARGPLADPFAATYGRGYPFQDCRSIFLLSLNSDSPTRLTSESTARLPTASLSVLLYLYMKGAPTSFNEHNTTLASHPYRLLSHIKHDA
ncbi:hypothetical protein BC628DRAFT_500444 [Trametes gibbosa]|nr:hypothetical protein BC628DRAFT_500444 [Trametes gibbosa]